MPDKAQLYEWECRHVLNRTDQDVEFWREEASSVKGLVLELACGTGRITFPLASAGIAIVGVDNDPAMLGAAERRRRHVRATERRPELGPWPLFVAADMRDFAFRARFAFVFVGYNSLQLLTGPGEMAACLTRARQHLARGGVVGVEVTDFQAGGAHGPETGGAHGPEAGGAHGPDAGADAGEWEPLGDAEGIRLSGALAHDLDARVSRYRRRFTGDGWAVDDEVVVRSVDRLELHEVISAAGLVAVSSWQTGTTIRVIAAPAT